MAYHLKALSKMQRRVAIWILGAFKTSPSYGIKAITGLVPIKLHLQKLGRRLQLQAYKLPPNHLVCSFIDSQYNTSQLTTSFLSIPSPIDSVHSSKTM